MKAGQFSDEQIVAALQEAARGEKPLVPFGQDDVVAAISIAGSYR